MNLCNFPIWFVLSVIESTKNRISYRRLRYRAKDPIARKSIHDYVQYLITWYSIGPLPYLMIFPCLKSWSPPLNSPSLPLHHCIPPSLFLSILKGTLANLIIDSPDAAVLRRGWNNLPILWAHWPGASSALAEKVKIGLKSFWCRMKAHHGCIHTVLFKCM